MTVLPKGYRWATEPETQVGWEAAKMISVPLTMSVNGHLYDQNESDMALPITEPVVLEIDGSGAPFMCTDEFDEHGDDHSQCDDTYQGMSDGYHDPYDYDRDDHEYNNYMYGSSRYGFTVGM